MPILTINTNVPTSQVPADFKAKMTEVLAKTLNKPKSYIAVHVNGGQDISFGGTTEPAALCELFSIGSLTAETNKQHSGAIMDLIADTLQVAPVRTYINFQNMDKANVGFMSTTFAELL